MLLATTENCLVEALGFQPQQPLAHSLCWFAYFVFTPTYALNSVTYATKQLTHALQELTRRSQQDEPQAQSAAPSVIPADLLQFSKEVESYLERRNDYSSQTRHVSVGSY